MFDVLRYSVDDIPIGIEEKKEDEVSSGWTARSPNINSDVLSRDCKVHIRPGMKIGGFLAEKCYREMSKPRAFSNLYRLTHDLLMSVDCEYDAIVSSGELLVFDEWRDVYVFCLESIVKIHVRVNMNLDCFRGLVFLSKVYLVHCFEESDFVRAKKFLDVCRNIWCRSDSSGSHCLMDIVSSAKIWRQQQFWVYALQTDLQRTVSLESGTVDDDRRLHDACHIISSFTCTLRELSVPKDKALEFITVLALSENIPSAKWNDILKLFDSVYSDRVIRPGFSTKRSQTSYVY
jgi:hypothetical protein